MNYQDCKKGMNVKVAQHECIKTTWIGTSAREETYTIKAHIGVIDDVYSRETDAGTVIVKSQQYGYLEVEPELLSVA